jgi:hypothetical protein
VENIDLQTLSEDRLVGTWRVSQRFGKPEHAEFLEGDELEFGSDRVFRTPEGCIGSWRTFKETELIYQPQVSIEVDGQPLAVAVITRLYLTKNGRGAVTHKLTLYFKSGLELMLQKTDVPTTV